LHCSKLWLIIGQIFASDREVPHFNALAGGDPSANIATSDISLTLFLGYISVGVSSTTFTQWAPKATEFGEITQIIGHYAVQGHSRSRILAPIESPYATSY